MKKISILSLDDSDGRQLFDTQQIVLKSLYDGVICNLSSVARIGKSDPYSKLLLSLISDSSSIELFDLVKSKKVVTMCLDIDTITVTVPITSATCEIATFEISDPDSIDGAIDIAVTEAISHIKRMRSK